MMVDAVSVIHVDAVTVIYNVPAARLCVMRWILVGAISTHNHFSKLFSRLLKNLIH